MTFVYPIPFRSRRQRGVSMLFAMMTLVILSLAAVALVRSVDTSSMVVGNLGFKQDTTVAAAAGTRQALKFLSDNAGGTALDADILESGYFASSLDKLDVTGNSTSNANKLALVDWLGDGKCAYADPSTFTVCITPATGTDVNGSVVKWVIMRLCAKPETPSPTNQCSKPAAASTSTASDRGELNPGGRLTSSTATPYYRVVVRAQGARNTVSFTETIVHF